MVQNERIIRHELVVEAGRRMMMAARTAPKARGVDIIEIALVSERADLEKLSAVMRQKGEEEMATHSGILAWRIPWTDEPGRLQSMEL